MLSIKESYNMDFKESWSTHGVFVKLSGSNLEELSIIREFILKGFDEIERRKKQ